MSTLKREAALRPIIRPLAAVWLVAASVLVTLLVLLSIAIKNDPTPSQDQTVLDRVVGWDYPGLAGFLEGINYLMNNWPAMALGVAGVAVLWLLGMTRVALGFAIVAGFVGVVAFVGDLTLGEVVERARPPEGRGGPNSYPSGHVFGSTVLFGFFGFLAVYYKLPRKILLPFIGVLFTLLLAVGYARIFEKAHWPSDVAASYLLGGLWLLLLVPFFLFMERVSWRFSPKQDTDLSIEGCESCRTERSIASVVILDPEKGTATKVYKPPPVVRLIYWLAFQARFPYERSPAALEAAEYRRRIASLLTIHRFGKDLVAPVQAASCAHGRCTFVTEYVPGEKVENDEDTRRFLGEVAEIFAEAGLGIRQVNPRNPHAHTNLIRHPDGDPRIIDLESAMVTVIPAPGQWRSTLRRGTFPVFDDIDFERLRHYIAANEKALEASLTPAGMTDLRDVVDRAEEAVRTWKDAEPHIWGRLASRVYRLLDWKSFAQHLAHALEGSNQAAGTFLSRGIARWESEGRISPSEAAALQDRIRSPEAQVAIHHLGVHLVLSVALFLPIPGLRSAARFAWTLAYWLKFQVGRILRRSGGATNIHTPLVMLLAIVPVLGGVAYLAARPLRQRLLARLMVDQVAREMPFRLYRRLRLARWLAPPRQSEIDLGRPLLQR